MAADRADHISGGQDISGSTGRKQRLSKGKLADGVYLGCVRQELLPSSPLFGRDSRAGRAVGELHIRGLIGGHCHEGGGELTKREASCMMGLGKKRIFVWQWRQ